MLNQEVFEHVKKHGKKILVVTKYWDKKKTLEILKEVTDVYPDIFFGLGENRTNILQEKELFRENTHFIGNIQSRDISKIIQYCSTIHSLEKIKHAEKIEKIGIYTEAFIQIRLDNNKDIGIFEEELPEFLQACASYKSLKIIGISGMGASEISEQEKRDEFKKLISLRDIYFPNGLISAGTSRDYSIALEEGMDIIRVGNGAVS